MARGTDTYKGLGLPTQGNPNLKALSTDDALTVTGSSGGAGNLLVLRTLPSSGAGLANAADSTLLTADQVRVTSAGAIQIMDNTTVVAQLSTAGLTIGGNVVISSLGGLAGGAQIVTINTTASTLVSSNSGKLHILSTQAATTNFIYLPTSGNARIGDTWELLSNTTAVSLWNLSILGANTGGLIYVHTGSTGAVNTTGAIDSTGSSGILWWKVVCISTTPEFVVTNNMIMSSLATTNAYMTIGAGTTA